MIPFISPAGYARVAVPAEKRVRRNTRDTASECLAAQVCSLAPGREMPAQHA